MIPKTAKLIVFSGPGVPLRMEERELPAPAEGEILVRNTYATLCRSDLSTYLGRRVEKTPTILGHEIVGRIVAQGSPLSGLDGRPLRVGDVVTWAIYAADPAGPMARRGIPQKAADLFKYGHERLMPESSWHGGLAEYTLLRRFTPVLALPEELPLPAAALISCAVSTAAGAMRLAGPLQGRRVAVWGAGMLGVTACAMAREAGAAAVVAVDPDAQRLAVAARFGATELVPAGEARPEAMQADVTMDFCGRPEAMEQTLGALAVGGTAVWVGGVCPQRPVRVDGERVVRRLLTVRGLHNYNAADFSTAVSFMTRCHGRYPFASLVRGGFPLEEAEEAFRYAVEHNPYRVGIDFKTGRP